MPSSNPPTPTNSPSSRPITAEWTSAASAASKPNAERTAGVKPKSALGHAYRNGLESLTRVQRRVDAANRLYLRTLKALQSAQAKSQIPNPSQFATRSTYEPSPAPNLYTEDSPTK